MGNPFEYRMFDGRVVQTITADDRAREAKKFTIDQCQAALAVPGLQKSVERAVRARLRLLGTQASGGCAVTWVDVNDALPDADRMVLACLKNSSRPVWLAYRDGASWCDVEGFPVEVTHWAEIPSPAVMGNCKEAA